MRVAVILSELLRATSRASLRAAARLDSEVVGLTHPTDGVEAPTLEARIAHLEMLQGVRDAR